MFQRTNRRKFLEHTSAGAIAITATGRASALASASEKLVVGLIGCGVQRLPRLFLG